MKLPKLNKEGGVPTGMWHLTEDNPAEATWHMETQDALLHGTDRTSEWLASCFKLSRSLSRLTDSEERAALLIYRPCDNQIAVSKRLNLVQPVYYSTLRNKSTEELQYDAADRLFRYLDHLESVDPIPAGTLITYCDDYQLLAEAARDTRFYKDYCVDRGLIQPD